MGRVIKINWRTTKELGDIFKLDAEDLMDVLDEMEATFESVREGWYGKDAENYILNGKDLVRRLRKEPKYLIDWYEFLTKTTYKYQDNVEEGLTKVRSVNAVFVDDYEEIMQHMGA
jgi:hypothetical protein